jgi:hypothetical protein
VFHFFTAIYNEGPEYGQPMKLFLISLIYIYIGNTNQRIGVADIAELAYFKKGICSRRTELN